MNKIFVVVAAVLALFAVSACTQTQQNAAIGAGAGAAIGGVATDSFEGAAVGAGVGAVAGTVIGRLPQNPEQCYYGDPNAPRSTWEVRECPRG